MAGLLLPNPEQVAVAWLKGNVPYLQGNVATELPKDVDSWRAVGFVVVTAIGGGVVGSGVRSTACSLRYVGSLSESGRVARGRTLQLAEQVREVVDPTNKPYGSTRAGYRLTNLGTAYKDAKVLNAFWTSEPRAIPGDIADFAVYQNDIELHWTVVEA